MDEDEDDFRADRLTGSERAEFDALVARLLTAEPSDRPTIAKRIFEIGVREGELAVGDVLADIPHY